MRIWGGGAARRLLLSFCIVVLCLNASVAALPIASASNNRQGDGRIPPRPKFAALEDRPDMIKVDLQSVARLDGLLKVVHEYQQMEICYRSSCNVATPGGGSGCADHRTFALFGAAPLAIAWRSCCDAVERWQASPAVLARSGDMVSVAWTSLPPSPYPYVLGVYLAGDDVNTVLPPTSAPWAVPLPLTPTP